MNPPEENPYGLTTTPSGGLIRRMDQRMELVNRLIKEIQAKKTEPPNSKTLEVPLGSGVVMLMKWCPAGSFLMGSPEDEEGRSVNENQVQVTFSQGFWMAQTQVTQAQWQAVMGNNPSHFRGENLPVYSVNWHEAQEFVSKINTSFALPDGMQMTLPTEAQWEYAARAGETGSYSGGVIDQVAWYRENSKSRTNPVGIKKPNAWGLHDMHGNVWEWCLDWYESELKGGMNPLGSYTAPYRVLRGGSWFVAADYCRAASRIGANPSGRAYCRGFRLARRSIPSR
jgi:formylglycine-generating enzyme required for sulfatase activity